MKIEPTPQACLSQAVEAFLCEGCYTATISHSFSLIVVAFL
jgi:hypothetical protein